jgi:hypothetical protein
MHGDQLVASNHLPESPHGNLASHSSFLLSAGLAKKSKQNVWINFSQYEV